MIGVLKRVDRRLKRQLQEVEVRRSLSVTRQNFLSFRRWLWFQMTRNRLLFWIGVANLSILLGAMVALLLPIWGSRTSSDLLSRDSPQPRSTFLRNGLPYNLSRPVNILILGIEPPPSTIGHHPISASATGTSDTMLLIRFNPARPAIRVLSIPKDSQVVLPKIGLDKISRAYALGGAPLTARVVSRTLNNVPIDRYLSINADALRQLVDRMGGIEVFVPERMAYQDRTQRLQIDLEQGWQTLSGEQAEQFARFRASNQGDLDRVQRQQMLIAALRDRLTSPAILPQLPEITKIMQTAVETNLSPEELRAIVHFSVQMKPEHWQMLLLPGDLSPYSQDPSSYWLYTSGQDQIMSQYFGTSTIGAAPKPKPLTSLKIAVQNASGKPQLSQKVVRYLKQKGFTNVYAVSDWSDIQRQTNIIAQKGDTEAATKIQQILGVGNIEAAAIGDLDSSLTIRVGKDWR
ncbi:LCP family protein [Chroococcidiopsis sp. FACHB-1243]|uniref:LCP family glycopolymer transferase n=1 Tax=Chroococcidiopsis sp. [FACHB-1243] TaxID=2692781 RepID=UPI00177FEB18|nr:LCP family protein [Chroococcidiopsis sp. [FACHB-1243]]